MAISSFELTQQQPVVRALPTQPTPAGVRQIAEALEEQIDAMADDALERIMLEIPLYAERGGAVTDDTRRAAAYVYTSFIEMLRTGQSPNESVARSLANVGANRAKQGIPLSDLLHAFRISARTIVDTLHQTTLRRDLDRDGALWVAEAIVLWMDIVSNLASHDYSRAQAKIVLASEELRKEFLLNVLFGGATLEWALDRANAVGWDPAADYWISVIGTQDGSVPTSDVIDEFATTLNLSFATNSLDDVVILVKVPSIASIDNIEAHARVVARRLGLYVGFSMPNAGIVGVRRAFIEATEALAIGRAVNQQFVHYEEAVLDRLLRRDLDLLNALVEGSITPLVKYDAAKNTELVQTLETYFELTESPTKTAAHLHTHPQTIRYRLGRIAEITGHNLESMSGRLHLMLALRGYKLQRVQTESPVISPAAGQGAAQL